jgi:predicted secreted protein
MKVVDLADRGTELVLADGETFEVRLPENGGTGYQWSVAGLADAVELLEDDFVSPEPALPGAQGVRRFRFIVRGPPSGRVALELRRSWEQTSEPEDAFDVRIAAAPHANSAVKDRPNE